MFNMTLVRRSHHTNETEYAIPDVDCTAGSQNFIIFYKGPSGFAFSKAKALPGFDGEMVHVDFGAYAKDVRMASYMIDYLNLSRRTGDERDYALLAEMLNVCNRLAFHIDRVGHA